MTVTDCTLCGNAAMGEAGGDGITNFGSGQGGGINDFDNLTVLNSTLTGNVAQGTPLAPGAVPSQTPSSGSATAGGGIFCLGVYVPAATVTVADSTLTGNQATGGAGGAGSAGSVGEGGGVSLIGIPSGLVTGCTVAHTVAQGGAGGTGGVGAPGASGSGLGTLQQGSLEQSNVDPVSSLIDLITTQRAFEMNSQTIQAGNECWQTINNLIK